MSITKTSELNYFQLLVRFTVLKQCQALCEAVSAVFRTLDRLVSASAAAAAAIPAVAFRLYWSTNTVAVPARCRRPGVRAAQAVHAHATGGLLANGERS